MSGFLACFYVCRGGIACWVFSFLFLVCRFLPRNCCGLLCIGFVWCCIILFVALDRCLFFVIFIPAWTVGCSLGCVGVCFHFCWVVPRSRSSSPVQLNAGSVYSHSTVSCAY